MINPEQAIALHNEIVDAVNGEAPITDEKARVYLAFLLTSFKNLSEVTMHLMHENYEEDPIHGHSDVVN